MRALGWRGAWLLSGAVLLLGGGAEATTISYFLDQTATQTTDPNVSAYDPDNALPDGVNYLQITLTDEGTAQPGDIDVTVTMLSFFEDPDVVDVNLGIQSFHFNDANDALTPGDIIGLPSGWSAQTDFDPANPNLVADGFGRFEVRLAGTGSNRLNPTLSFTIRVAGDSVDTYAVDGPGGDQGTFFFAAEVRGFQDQNSLGPVEGCQDLTGQGEYTPQCNILNSVWLGGSTQVPEPATALLLVTGLGLLGWFHRRDSARG